MVKKFQVNLAKFTHGQIDNTFNFYNFNSNYYETASKIQNFILNNNSLQRRPPLQCISVIQGGNGCFIYGINNNNNNNITLALVKHNLNVNNIESSQQIEFYNNKNFLASQHPNMFTHGFNNKEANVNHYSVYNNTLYLFSNYYSYKINLDTCLTTPPLNFNLIDGPYIDNTDTSTTFYANSTINLEGKTMQIVTTNKQLDDKNLYKDKHRFIKILNSGVLVGMQEGVFLLSSFKAEENISPLNYQVNKLFNTNCGLAFCNDFSGVVFADITGKNLYKITVNSNADAKLQQLNTYCTSLFNSGIKKWYLANTPIILYGYC